MDLSTRRRVFHEYLLETFPKVYNYVRRLVHQPEVAEDLTQEAFLKAWQAFDRFNLQKPFLPWILQIARHTALDYFRKHRERIDLAQASEPKERAPSPEQNLLDQEKSIRLEAALQQLPETQRTAIFLYYQEQLDTAALATVLQKTKSGVESLLHRARQRLQKILTPGGFRE